MESNHLPFYFPRGNMQFIYLVVNSATFTEFVAVNLDLSAISFSNLHSEVKAFHYFGP